MLNKGVTIGFGAVVAAGFVVHRMYLHMRFSEVLVKQ